MGIIKDVILHDQEANKQEPSKYDEALAKYNTDLDDNAVREAVRKIIAEKVPQNDTEEVKKFLFGSIELKKPAGNTPEVFVLAGAGTGISVYRKLQRENVPFATGVLYENDVDYRLARLLAVETVSVPAFAAPDDAVYEKAFETMRRCGRILLAGDAARTPNAPLLTRAKAAGLAVLDAKTEGWTL